MTTRATIARHRAEVTKTNSLAVIAKAVGDNAGGMGRQAAVIAAASGLVLTSGIAANAADTNVQRESASASNLEVEVSAPGHHFGCLHHCHLLREAGCDHHAGSRRRSTQARRRGSGPAAQAVATVNGSRTPSAPKAPVCRQRQGQAIAVRSLRPAGRCAGLHHAGHQLPGRRGHQLPRLAGRLPVPRPDRQRRRGPARRPRSTTQTAARAWPTSLSTPATARLCTAAGTAEPTVMFSANVGSGPVFIRVGG